ncbi:MAG TPA: DinB family protein, partial [Nocardioidaceae bacterium]|nr:DinB family protein [Nocardioidaceae bacterium]
MTTLSIPFLVDYLYWMRDRVLDGAAALAGDAFVAPDGPTLHGRTLRATLAHELDVEMSWRGKLQGLPIEEWGPAAEIKPDRFGSVAELRAAWRDHEHRTRSWVAGLTAADL